ncbi:MAG: YrhB domain-containing protein [Streptomyces sp.]
MVDARQQALHWLQATYGGLVELAQQEPVAEDSATWLFGCRSMRQPGYPPTPMLAASVVVPKDGSIPFHPAANDPLADIAEFGRAPSPRLPENQARKLNSRGCVVTVASAINGAPTSSLPWTPAHEAPGWWTLLLRRYFPGAEQLHCASWDDVIVKAQEPGLGTQGVVWVRRETGGVETTGHLIYVLNDKNGVTFLDGMTGALAKLDAEGIRSLTFARTRPTEPPRPAPASTPWQAEADNFTTAVVKAETWLRRTYEEPVALLDPAPADEMARGWLFACNTEAFIQNQDWTQGMLDAALIVPKAASEPFLLSNAYPWHWLDAWNNGREPGDGVLPFPPEPGPAAWLQYNLKELGSPISVTEHDDWVEVFDELRAMPPGARALVWIRRRDARGRESTGFVLTGLRTNDGPAILDGSANPIADLNPVAANSFRLIRYR